MNLLFLNVRGLGRGERCISIRKLIHRRKLSLVGLVETKHGRSFNRRIRRMWGNDEFEWCESLASETYSGGIITVWDPNIFCVSQRFISDRWIILDGHMVKSNFCCCVGIIYAPNDREGRKQMYESLKAIRSNIGKPVLFMGDFNEVTHPRERIGVYRFDASMHDFIDWISDLCLIDLPLHGIKFTWARGNSQSKLDRCLCNDEWLVNFPHIRLDGLPKGSSDHNPLLLALEAKLNWGPKPFRCFDSWFLHPNFKEFVRKEWKDLPNLCLVNKMKALKTPIKLWSME